MDFLRSAGPKIMIMLHRQLFFQLSKRRIDVGASRSYLERSKSFSLWICVMYHYHIKYCSGFLSTNAPRNSRRDTTEPFLPKIVRVSPEASYPLNIIKYPGSRIMQLRYYDGSEFLISKAQLKTLKYKIFNYEENHLVSAYFIGSSICTAVQ